MWSVCKCAWTWGMPGLSVTACGCATFDHITIHIGLSTSPVLVVCNQFLHVVTAEQESMEGVCENNKNPQGHLMGSGTRKIKREHHKYAVICILSRRELSFHWSTISSTEHLRTKHVLVAGFEILEQHLAKCKSAGFLFFFYLFLISHKDGWKNVDLLGTFLNYD